MRASAPSPFPSSRPGTATTARILALCASVVLLGGLAAPACAATYYGWGDTGWTFDNKRDCCDEAVWLAQDQAAAACEAAGGRPRMRSGTSRGTCDWDARGGTFDRVYRCTARSSADCR